MYKWVGYNKNNDANVYHTYYSNMCGKKIEKEYMYIKYICSRDTKLEQVFTIYIHVL